MFNYQKQEQRIGLKKLFLGIINKEKTNANKPFLMKDFSAKLHFNFATKKPLKVKFSGLDLSTDSGLLLVKQAEENLKICEGIANSWSDKREQHKVKHPQFQLVSQRIYQIVAGYEDTNDSNYLRHDPIFKIICDKIPRIGAELLASQPTISRLENQITKQEIKAIRRFFVDKFLQNYREAPQQIILDIDGWDARSSWTSTIELISWLLWTSNLLSCIN